jgi:hypothetical protein
MRYWTCGPPSSPNNRLTRARPFRRGYMPANPPGANDKLIGTAPRVGRRRMLSVRDVSDIDQKGLVAQRGNQQPASEGRH